MANVIGIDIGGSGIKGAVVDTQTGDFISERVRIPTPKKSTPAACAKVIGKILAELDETDDYATPVGIAIPAPVVHGTIPMIANLDKAWLDLNADKFFTKELKRPVMLVNDADAAGLAEVYCGAAKDHPGIVIVTTLGTGIGSAIINNGVLLPNTELGHLEIDHHDAETRASAGVREKEKMSYEEWAGRLDRYYQTVEKLFWPDLFVVGGGVSKNHKQFLPLLHLRTPIIPAELRNRAGIVGAALIAAESLG
jgi:polyphosphate glucokinase